MLFDTHESKRLFLQAITTCCVVRSCQTLKYRIKATKQNRNTEIIGDQEKMQDICSRIKQKLPLLWHKYIAILKGKRIEEKNERSGSYSSGSLYCKSYTDTPLKSPIFLYAFWLRLALAISKTYSKTRDPTLWHICKANEQQQSTNWITIAFNSKNCTQRLQAGRLNKGDGIPFL